MKNRWLILCAKMRNLMKEEGQDLIEYALVVALIAFAATTAMGKVASSLNNAFTKISTTLDNSV